MRSRSYRRYRRVVTKARHLRILRIYGVRTTPWSFYYFGQKHTVQPRSKPWTPVNDCCMKEPGWWTREFHTQPARIDANRKCRDIVRGLDPDGMQWLDGKKPHIYYW